MKHNRLRYLAFVAVCVLAAISLRGGGSSNNLGKIEGRWKVLSSPDMDEKQRKFLDESAAELVIEFRPDGTVTAGLETKNPELLAELAKNGEVTSVSGRYKLLSGDNVQFSGMGGPNGNSSPFGNGDKQRLIVKVEGDKMTIIGTDGPSSLARVK